ncbi:MAG: hypothetical protein WCQ00_02570 [bacterium]
MKNKLAYAAVVIFIFVLGVAIGIFYEYEKLHNLVVQQDRDKNIYLPMSISEVQCINANLGKLDVQASKLGHKSIVTWPTSVKYIGCWDGKSMIFFENKPATKLFEQGWQITDQASMSKDSIIYVMLRNRPLPDLGPLIWYQ